MLNQVRKPTKWTGKVIVRIMNKSHLKLTDWGLAHFNVMKEYTILDVGCGGGITIKKLAKLAPLGKIYGIDYAHGSFIASCEENAELIHSGRVEIKKASVSELPFADNTFDCITAVETHYYWPDLSRDLKEIMRVLKPEATFIIIAESYNRSRQNLLERRIMKFFKSVLLTVDEHRELLSTAGYTDIQVFEEKRQGWICVLGRKRKNNFQDKNAE
jgi:ubiquinone/menaquinone biosynthesis C-methylase UbiE